jgi:hypothetical protein
MMEELIGRWSQHARIFLRKRLTVLSGWRRVHRWRRGAGGQPPVFQSAGLLDYMLGARFTSELDNGIAKRYPYAFHETSEGDFGGLASCREITGEHF